MNTIDPRERLESWKQIAGYLGKSERTVRRWQQTEGMPVHRHQHQQRGSVWAYSHELDAWLEARRLNPEPLPDAPETRDGAEAPDTPEAPERRHKTPLFVWGTLAIATGIATGAWVLRPADARSGPLHPTPLTSMPGASYGASLAPDGMRVVFQYFPMRSGTEPPGIYIKRIGAQGLTAVALGHSNPSQFLYGPSWSPDGKTIAYLRRIRSMTLREGAETWLDVVPPEGGPSQPLVRLSDGHILFANHMHLSWTPDSKWIVAPMAVGERKGIPRISLQNAELRQLTAAERIDYGAQLSPDGRALVFLRQKGIPPAGIESVLRQDLAADGNPSGPARTIYSGRSQSSGIAWTPSGKHLVFCNSTNAFLGPFNSRLFLLRAQPDHAPVLLDSSDCSTVTISKQGPSGKPVLVYASGALQQSRLYAANLQSMASPKRFAPSSRFDALPEFSPDGRMAAFLSSRDGIPEVWVANRDGGAPRKLTDGSGVWSGPRWSPDGTRLLCGAGRRHGSGEHELLIVPLSGGPIVRIPISNEPYASDPFWAPDGEHVYYWAQTDSTLRSLRKVHVRGGQPLLVGNYAANFQQKSVAGRDAVYYSGSSFPFALTRISLTDGRTEVLAEMASPFFAVSDGSLYFLRRVDRRLCSLPLTGGALKEFGSMPEFEGVGRFILGITVSAQNSTILWGLNGEQQLDLEMVTDFRL